MDGTVYLGLTQHPTSISLAFCLCVPLPFGGTENAKGLDFLPG